MPELERTEVLCIPKRRRLLHSKQKDAEGQEVLRIFYGDKEVVFDEPALLPFGDMLLQVERFRAEEAMAWSNGAPHEWTAVQEMLEALLDEEILKRVTDEAASPSVQTYPATLGLAPADREPRTFSAAAMEQCPAITAHEYGRAIDLSNLETVIPVYRVAHPALDRDGRQVGENNVMLPSLFLDRPTQRRQCNYAGTRYQATGPMNVTALKHMTSRWPELLSLTEQFRTAFFARLAAPASSSIHTGDLQLLTVCMLASVGYVMVRGDNPISNGELDAGLAAMFRLVDGVRLVTTDVLRATAGEHGCARPITAKGVADYAEQEGMYHGVHGVCAGPQALIDEYLRVLVGEAGAPVHAAPNVGARLGDLDAALDYGFWGQRVESMIRIFGASQGLLHHRLKGAFQDESPRTKLHELLDAPIDAKHYAFFREDHPLVENFKLEIEVNRWLMERAREGLPADLGALEKAEALTRLDPGSQAVSREKLAEFFAHVPSAHGALRPSLRDELVAVTADVLALERHCLRSVSREQRSLNERLGREPGRVLTGDDLAIYNRPRTGPTFEATLEKGLGIAVTTTATSSVLSYEGHTLSLAD